MSLTRVLSVVLALIAATFASLGAIDVIRKIKIAGSWRRIDAVVDEVNISPTGDDKIGAVSLKLRYVDGLVERSAWVYQALLPGQAENFLRQYAIGTRHLVYVNPSAPEEVELKLGWNFRTMLVPIFLGIICICVATAARYFWRFERQPLTPSN